MRARSRLATAALTVVFVAVTPLAALGGERNLQLTDAAGLTTDVPDRPAITDRPTDRITDRPSEGVTDRPNDKPGDRPSDRVVDRPNDRPVKRCVELADNPRRCLHDEVTDHINIRQLIWRLIHAHEWKKLIRLLHYLGWV